MSEREPITGASTDYGAVSTPPSIVFSEFNATELYNLSESVGENIGTINSSIKSLEKWMRQIGGPNDNLQLREKVHNTQQNANSCVSATARDINRLSVMARRGDKPQQLQAERLTQTFTETLSTYSTVQKQLTEKMAAHMPKQARVRNDPMTLEQQAIADDEEAQLLANQQTQARLVQFETSLALEKEEYMNKIEADVLDVNVIFQQLSELAHSQAQTVDTVESHIEAAASGVEVGQDELAKAAEYQRRYRRKMFILILIAMIIGALLIVWIVKAFK